MSAETGDFIRVSVGVCPVPYVPNGRVICIIRGKEIGPNLVLSSVPTWGSTCNVKCNNKYLPTHSADFVCRNNGDWLPAVPQCLRKYRRDRTFVSRLLCNKMLAVEGRPSYV